MPPGGPQGKVGQAVPGCLTKPPMQARRASNSPSLKTLSPPAAASRGPPPTTALLRRMTGLLAQARVPGGDRCDSGTAPVPRVW